MCSNSQGFAGISGSDGSRSNDNPNIWILKDATMSNNGEIGKWIRVIIPRAWWLLEHVSDGIRGPGQKSETSVGWRACSCHPTLSIGVCLIPGNDGSHASSSDARSSRYACSDCMIGLGGVSAPMLSALSSMFKFQYFHAPMRLIMYGVFVNVDWPR